VKRNEIKAHEVIAYQRGSYGYPTPAAVIDTGSLWTRRNNRDSTTWRRAAGWKCGSDRLYHEETGYLVVKFVYFGGIELDEGLKLLHEWLATLPEQINEPFVKQAANNMPEGLTLDIEANRHLHGPWEAAKAADDAARQARHEQYDREQAEHRQRARTVAGINQALEERGFSGTARRSGALVEIDMSTLAALLGVESEGGA
jgi:hypothetical protein